jgi:hypothetical protein
VADGPYSAQVAEVKALGTLAPESLSALQVLRSMRFDNSERVRIALRGATAAIEKGKDK